MDVDNPIYKAIIDVSTDMDPLIKATPGSVTVTLEGSISSASAFAAKSSSDYNVVGINKKSAAASGVNNHAAFLDNISAGGSAPDTISSRLIGDYVLNFRLPEWPSLSTSHPLEIPIVPEIKIFGVTVPPTPINGHLTLTLEKVNPDPDDDVSIEASIKIIAFNLIIYGNTFKVWEDYISKIFELSSSGGSNLRCQDFAKTIVGSTPNWPAFQWSSSGIVTVVQAEFNTLLGTRTGSASPPPGSTFNAGQAVEKGGYLRLTAQVYYQPGTTGTMIHRTLMAEREFKVADTQPVAPEYVFFVANSDLPYENIGADKMYPDPEYDPDSEIKFINLGATGIMATSSIHPFPQFISGTNKANYPAFADAFNGTVTENSHIPGMVRINGTKKMLTNVFSGRLADVRTTEYNALFVNKTGLPPTNPPGDLIDPRFGWDGDVSKPFITPYIPLPPGNPPLPPGLESIMDILKTSMSFDTATQLQGDFFFEYPLGWKIEGYLFQRYSSVAIGVNPIINPAKLLAAVTFSPFPVPSGLDPIKAKKADETEVKVQLSHPEKPFGVWDYPAHNSPPPPYSKWDPNNPQNLPANLYSPLQYAKKADHFYADNAEFQADLSNRIKSGVFDCTGVTFIKEGVVELPIMQVEGRGLLIANRSINVKGNITRKAPASGRTVFGLIARNGQIITSPGVTRIEAACYSNYQVDNAPGNALFIDGNLIVNHFRRDRFNSIEVFYNGPACRDSLLSMIRDVGKFDQTRYHVSLGKQWGRFAYEKQ